MPETATPYPPTAATPTLRRAMLRWVTRASLVVAVVMTVLYAVTGGAKPAVSAAAAGLVVLAFFVSGVALVTLSTRATNADGTVMMLVMAGYIAQAIALFAVLLIFGRTDVLDHHAFGITLLVGTFVAIAAATLGFVRTKVPTVEPVPSVAPTAAPPAVDARGDRL